MQQTEPGTHNLGVVEDEILEAIRDVRKVLKENLSPEELDKRVEAIKDYDMELNMTSQEREEAGH